MTDVTASVDIDYGVTSFNERTDMLRAGVTLTNSGMYAITGPLLVGVRNITSSLVTVRGIDGVTPDGIPYYNVSHLAFTAEDADFAEGDIVTALDLSFYNPQHVQFGYELVVLGHVNRAPQFTSEPLREVAAGGTYRYQATSTDPEDDRRTYSRIAGPENLLVDEGTGVVTWVTAAGDVGTHAVTIRVADEYGLWHDQQYVIAVTEGLPNRPPVFTSTPVVDVYVNVPYSYQATARDLDGDTLSFTVVPDSGPDGYAIADPQAGLATWTPPAELVGQHVPVTLQVSDGRGGTAEQPILLYVHPEPGNHDPIIVSDPDREVDLPPLTLNPATGTVALQEIRLALPPGTSGSHVVTVTLPQGGVPQTSDVVIVVDESASMGTEHAWLAEMVPLLEQTLGQAGLTNNRYVLAGYGYSGEHYRIFSANAADEVTVTVSIYGPDNERILRETVPVKSLSTALEAFDLPADGQYTVVVESPQPARLSDPNATLPNGPYDYQFVLDQVEVPPAVSLNLNTTTQGRIRVPGSVQRHQFTLSADTLLYFDSFIQSGTFHWSLSGLSGHLVTNRDFNRSDSGAALDSDVVIAAPAGDYTLTVGAKNSAVGDYAFRLLDLLSTDSSSPVVSLTPGQSRTGTLDPLRETDAYRFAAAAGDRYFFEGRTIPIVNPDLHVGEMAAG